jgi:hypothetical protein
MLAPQIMWLDDLKSERGFAKRILEKAKESNPLSFLFFPHEKKRADVITAHCLSYQNKSAQVIHARNCEIKEMSKISMMEFCDNYHIQGSNNLSVYQCGLFHKNVLVGVMSLGRHSRINDDTKNIVLDRFCFKPNIRVNGGASKLFNKCKKWALDNDYTNIWTYSDNRYTNGNVYAILGFNKSEILPQDYFYVSKSNFEDYHSKQSQKKDLVGCPEHITEKQWAEEKNNLLQIYDCGKIKWNFILRKEYRSLESFTNRRTGFYPSKKGVPKNVHFQSSYELRAFVLLDQDESVEKFTTQVRFISKDGKERFADILVTMTDGRKKIQEIKPKSRLKECENQILDISEYAKENSYEFEVLTETELGFSSDYYLLKWADEFKTTISDVDFTAQTRENNCTKAKNFYHKHNKFINVHCPICNEIHNIREKQYEKNIEKNGYYKCGKKSSSDNGKKPKDHLRVVNPYASEGKKQCRTCNSIKLIQGNFTWKSKPSEKKPTGTLSADCNECRKEIEKQKYHAKKAKSKSENPL